MTSSWAVLRRALPSRSQWPMLIWLVAVWVALWGNLSVANVVSGLAVALLLKAVLPMPPLPVAGRVDVRAVVVLVAHFLRDLVVSSAQIAWQALRPGPPPGVAVVAVGMRSSSEALLTLTAELVSLVPGSIVLEIDPPGRTLYLHALGVPDHVGVEAVRRRTRAVESRVLAAFDTPRIEEKS